MSITPKSKAGLRRGIKCLIEGVQYYGPFARRCNALRRIRNRGRTDLFSRPHDMIFFRRPDETAEEYYTRMVKILKDENRCHCMPIPYGRATYYGTYSLCNDCGRCL